MAEEKVDRDAILARRALLVGSTLAALSCSSPGKQGADAAVETANVPPPASAPSGAGSALPRPPAASSWEAVMTGAPPLEAPPPGASISEDERRSLTDQATSMRAAYGELEQLWKAGPPDCGPASCRDRWDEPTRQLSGILRGRQGPRCGWGINQPISYIERELAHGRFLHEQAEALEARFAEAAKRAGEEDAWERLRLANVIPQPCLSCMAPPPRVLEWISFDEGATDAKQEAEHVVEALAEMLSANPGLRVAIRGHADPAEAGDKLALSKKRAESVAARLTKKGVPASRLVIVPLGDAVPIESSKGPRRASNRRVDFESAR